MLLAVDTSTTQVGIALYDGVQVIGASSWYGKLRHTISLAPEIDALLKRTNSKMDSVTALGVAIGPGSFTSLRVGLSLMKGLALSRKLPLIGIPTLDILSTSQPTRDIRLACLLQAGRGRLAVGYYNASNKGIWEPEENLSVMRIDELAESIKEPTLICGELTAEEREIITKVKLAELCSPARSLRNPACLAEIAWQRYQEKDTDDATSLSPIYLQVGAQIPS
ncbi:MAG: tRNA (adenosine(37)-N6)-threonylcarbamoyltransferase complex dimerization subunit type 1 TsaB [Anaerolineae bacterium]|jgi:tRNA threonylcarbamoyladenosine biosynthesis protein TsaB|nr:tRNA (adenosine(37)-N6)-threonylcarbamoyltransferase complex dimerization subunit type 1 TsaB [Anaerolineae bacterium]MBT7783827.1 tRNA (adenosine(37)-N6)-threonylcarbamoyltransferase complex dimerization subunit type 1 TsaB [Anaerolineae bacterium]